MTNGWKRLIACLLALALVSTLAFGCGDGDEEPGAEKPDFTIGLISDFTGPASPALMPMHYGIDDLARYWYAFRFPDRIPPRKGRISCR